MAMFREFTHRQPNQTNQTEPQETHMCERRMLPSLVSLALGLTLSSGCIAEMGDEDGGGAPARTVDEVSRPLAAQSWRLWRAPAGTAYTRIPVCFEPDSGFTVDQKAQIRTYATDSWDAVSRIIFTDWGTCKYTDIRTGQACTNPDFNLNCFVPHPDQWGIHVTKAPANGRSWVEDIGSELAGARKGMAISPRTSGAIRKHAVVHEFGHALGFTHEQERSDNTACDADATHSEPDLGITLYDNNSVMSYCGPNNGELTPDDIEGVRGLYGYDSHRLVYSNFVPYKYAVRAASGHFLRADSGNADVHAPDSHIKSLEKFYIDKVSGPVNDNVMRFGDVVNIISHDYYYLRALTSGNNWNVDKSTVFGFWEQWVLVNANNPASVAPVAANQEVAFRSIHGRYLYRQSDNGNVRAHNPEIMALEKWRIVVLPYGGDV